jgi:hypothetical protein
MKGARLLETSIDTHCGWCLQPAPEDDQPEASQWLAWVIGHWKAFLVICPACAVGHEQRNTRPTAD